jgi:hypothetical protein
MQKRPFAVLACALLLAAGCTAQQNANQSASPPPTLRNPLDFALYPGAGVVTSRAFTQKIIVQNPQNGSIFEAGSGTYSGHEVIAASNASFSQLSSWVGKLSTNPPKGYSPVETGQNPQAQTQAQQIGLDYASFQKKDGSRTRGVLVIVMDPQRVNEKFGRILGMIAKYRALPEVMRAPIDNEAKARIGMSITEATQPDSPIGAALAALDQFQHRNARGIVVVDAVKR